MASEKQQSGHSSSPAASIPPPVMRWFVHPSHLLAETRFPVSDVVIKGYRTQSPRVCAACYECGSSDRNIPISVSIDHAIVTANRDGFDLFCANYHQQISLSDDPAYYTYGNPKWTELEYTVGEKRITIPARVSVSGDIGGLLYLMVDVNGKEQIFVERNKNMIPLDEFLHFPN